ncbi:MAG: DUF3791 domain-containing protein [Lachnospiraceae bacterium]|nr:DUF3791 domain-containing protein [Lachnospiraceae bacterium]
MNQEQMPFVVYLIHACAHKWSKSPEAVYQLLRDSNCIDGYLVPNYEILHTQGMGYLVDDLKGYLKLRGIQV